MVGGFCGDAGAGVCRWSRRSILFDIRLSRVEERCTLAHELVHAERGPFPRWLTAREEAVVDAEAACRLILLDALGEALAWSLYPAVVALAVLTESEVPAGPGFATNLGWLEVLPAHRRSPALQAGSSPKDRAMGGTSGLRNRLFALVVV